MKLHQHTHDERPKRIQRFCGPGALSVILGITAEEGARLINAANGKGYCDAPVKGTAPRVMLEILKYKGISVKQEKVTWKYGTRKRRRDYAFYDDHYADDRDIVQQNDTLNQWYQKRSRKDFSTMFLIVCGRHFVTVHGNWIADNQQGKVLFEKSKHKKKRVTMIFRLTQASI